MAYTVLARRYRSNTFDEVIGQGHISQTLKKAIESERIAHAYLFTGTRGTGKTSSARILAKALNCEKSDGPTTQPCGKCESCLAIARGDDIDVIEIDAASNTGVDNVRDIISNAQYRPARSRFKVYIIDEVHMLSKSAFNALLKILEEPPSHVKFILATTEPEKVLPTILSRCQRYDFRNISTREIAGHLREICKKEKIKADDAALQLVAKAGAGSMRDALSLLDRLLSVGEQELTVEMIEQLLGLPHSQLIFDLAQSIGEGEVKRTLEGADKLVRNGLSVDALMVSLVDHLRNLLILRTCGGDSELVEVPGLPLADLVEQAGQFDPIVLTQDITILEELRRQIRQSQAGRALLDAILVRMALADQFSSIEQLMGQVDGRPSLSQGAAQKKKIEVTSASAVGSASADVPAPARQIPSAEADPTIQTPAVLPPQSPVDEEDDDLPRPGKVWDSSGPDLAELLRQSAATAPPPEPAAATPRADDNVVPPDNDDVARIWPALMAMLDTQGAALKTGLSMAQLIEIKDNQAVIRFNGNGATFARNWAKNGKKDTIRALLCSVMGKDVGVRFEIEEASSPPSPAPTTAAAAPSPEPAFAPRTATQSHPRAVEPPTQPASVPGIRLTPELKQQLETIPLVKAVMQELGGTILKVE